MYKPGQLIKIRNVVARDRVTDAVHGMNEFKDCLATITRIVTDYFYRIDIDNEEYAWHHTLFEQPHLIEIGDPFKIVPFVAENYNDAIPIMEEYIGRQGRVSEIRKGNRVVFEGCIWDPFLLDFNIKPTHKDWWPKHFRPSAGYGYRRNV